MIGEQVNTILLLYVYGFGNPPPSSHKSLASHPARLDIAARSLIAFMYTVPFNIRRHRGLAVILEGVKGVSPRTIVFDVDCLPNRLSHESAYRLVYANFLGFGDCKVYDGLGFDAAASVLEGLGYTIVLLSERGVDVKHVYHLLRKPIAYVLGGAIDPPQNMFRHHISLSIGPYSYHADHVAAFISVLDAYPQLWEGRF